MKVLARTRIAIAIVAVLASAQLANGAGKTKPNVVILATGGTIAGAAKTGTQAGYTSGAVNIDTMIAAVPGITDLANIKGEQISNVGSQDMTFDIMLKLARRINELAKSPDVDGIVITHGTDTMEDTAFFLNLTVKTDKPGVMVGSIRHSTAARVDAPPSFLNLTVKPDKPVVMVGSMRPSTAVSADGPLNLYNAVGVAADPKAKGRGVLVVMDDTTHAPPSLTKTSTTAVQTFLSPIRGVVGSANYGKNDFYSSPEWKHTTQTEF